MADLHILREHVLGLPTARTIAYAWAKQVEGEFGMECTYEEGASADQLTFVRSGVHGSLQVTASQFELNAQPGAENGGNHRYRQQPICIAQHAMAVDNNFCA